jgi:hypothetical protein
MDIPGECSGSKVDSYIILGIQKKGSHIIIGLRCDRKSLSMVFDGENSLSGSGLENGRMVGGEVDHSLLTQSESQLGCESRTEYR